jgi:hypothetical protein
LVCRKSSLFLFQSDLESPRRRDGVVAVCLAKSIEGNVFLVFSLPFEVLSAGKHKRDRVP